VHNGEVTVYKGINHKLEISNMRSMDTHPEIEKKQIELLRQAPTTKRFALMSAWSRFIRGAARENIRKDHPEASDQEIELMLVARLYGDELAEKVRKYLVERNKQ
jgi:hypothetical protein